MGVKDLAPLALPFLSELIAKATTEIGGVLKASRAQRIRVDFSEAREGLMAHIGRVETWMHTVTLSVRPKAKRLEESLIELDLTLGASRYTQRNRAPRSITVDKLFPKERHLAVVGRPGAGKTTTLQRFAQLAHSDWVGGEGGPPVLIRLRDLRAQESIASRLLGELGLAFSWPKGLTARTRQMWERRVFLKYLETTRAILMVDGLDETDIGIRHSIETELREIALAAGQHRLIVTCRASDYRVALENVEVYAIQPLSEKQVSAFARKWLGHSRATGFVQAVKDNPYAGAELVPLTLAHLCAIYERDGGVPPRPIDVYETVVSLLIEQWDRERGIKRASRYSEFSWRKRERFLQAIAYELAKADRKGSFRHQDLEHAYARVCQDFGLPLEQSQEVVEEIESHTGLILQTGPRQYDFVHLVMQEFLMAMHVHRSAHVTRDLVDRFPNELALVVAYSVTADEYLEEILELTLESLPLARQAGFAQVLLERLEVERPAFRPSARAGWVVLGFLDILTRSYATSVRPQVSSNLHRLLKQPPMRHSVASALRQAEVYRRPEETLLIEKPHSDIPPRLRKILTSRAEVGLRISNDWASNSSLTLG